MSVTNQDIEYMQYLIGAKNKLVCGADTAIKALRPNAKYDLSVQGGVYEWLSWEDPTGTNPPTKEEIFTDVPKLMELNQEKEMISKRLEELYELWGELAE